MGRHKVFKGEPPPNPLLIKEGRLLPLLYKERVRER
jgi:hypothetical protein